MTNRSRPYVARLSAMICIAMAVACKQSPPKSPIESKVVYSDAFTIDTMWASMQGPYRVMQVALRRDAPIRQSYTRKATASPLGPDLERPL